MYNKFVKKVDKNEQIFYIINGDSIPKNRKCECTNKAQTIIKTVILWKDKYYT